MNIIFNIYFFHFVIFVWIYLFNQENFYRKNKKHYLTYAKMIKNIYTFKYVNNEKYTASWR